MSIHFGKVSASTLVAQLQNHQKFFISSALYGLPIKYSHVCAQILGSPTEAIMDSTSATLLRVPTKASFES